MGGTVKMALKGIGILIGTYLVVAHATGAGRLINSGASGGSKVIKTLQARA